MDAIAGLDGMKIDALDIEQAQHARLFARGHQGTIPSSVHSRHWRCEAGRAAVDMTD